MFDTSEAYKKALNTGSNSYLTGTITLPNGTVHDINDKTLANGSVSITMQSVTGDMLEFGAAVLGELDIAIITNESRYNFFDAIITLQYNVFTDDGVENIPLGVYNVSEAERDKSALKMVAYDNMLKLDKPYALSLSGKPYEIMDAVVTDCGCELGDTEEYFKNLPNGEAFITINPDSGCTTYRQVVSSVAQLCGCFVQSDRYGRIVFRQFCKTPNRELKLGERYSSAISDFVCKYISLSVTSSAGTYTSIAEDDHKTGLTMTISDAPAWDYGLEEVLQGLTDNLFAELEQIEYTPATITSFSDPSMDCGDMIKLETDDSDVEVNVLVTSYTWNYHRVMEIASVGSNPYLVGGQSDSQKILRKLSAEIDATKVIFYPFQNYEKIKLGTELDQVAYVAFTSVEETSIILNATFEITATVADIIEETTLKLLDADGVEVEHIIPYHRDGKATLKIHYLYNESDLGVEYMQTLQTGHNIISLYYPINNVKADSVNRFAIWMSIEGGSGYIDEKKLIGAVSGQGLAATAKWDGYFTMEEELSPITLSPNMRTIDVDTSFKFGFPIPKYQTPHDYIGAFGVSGSIRVVGIEDNIRLFAPVTRQTVSFGISQYTHIVDSQIIFNKDYSYSGHMTDVDSGLLATVTVNTDQFAQTNSIKVEAVYDKL